MGDSREQDGASRRGGVRSPAAHRRAIPISRGFSEGMVGGQFWSVYIPGDVRRLWICPRCRWSRSTSRAGSSRNIRRRLLWALTAADLRRAHKEGKIGSLLGLEGGHAIENSLGTLRAYYDLGARYMTLTHNVTTALGRRRARFGEARRVDSVRERSRARDESHGNARRPRARFAGDDERRPRRHRSAGDLLAFGRRARWWITAERS